VQTQVRDYLVNIAAIGAVTSPGSGSPNRLLFVVTSQERWGAGLQ
jgi:hypothetical protein